MIWIWVAIGVVVVSLIVLGIVGLGTAQRLRPLESALNAPELPVAMMALQTRMAGLQVAATDMQTRVQTTQERLEAIKAARTAGN